MKYCGFYNPTEKKKITNQLLLQDLEDYCNSGFFQRLWIRFCWLMDGWNFRSIINDFKNSVTDSLCLVEKIEDER